MLSVHGVCYCLKGGKGHITPVHYEHTCIYQVRDWAVWHFLLNCQNVSSISTHLLCIYLHRVANKIGSSSCDFQCTV